MKPIRVISLFDGISCGRLALQRAGIPVGPYIACEIDPYAIQVSESNRDDVSQFWDVRDFWRADRTKTFYEEGYWDLLIGWSPCQWFSNAGKGLNFLDPRSKLFFEFVRILNDTKPKYFLLENVPMKSEWIKIINQHLWGVQPMIINSSLVSAQNRKRLYRVGKREGDRYITMYIPLPEDKKISLGDILLDEVDQKYVLSEQLINGFLSKKSIFRDKFKITYPEDKWACLTTKSQWSHITQSYVLCNINPSGRGQNGNIYTGSKSPTLTTNKWEWPKILQLPRGNNRWSIFSHKTSTLTCYRREHNNLLHDGCCLRRLTPIECERLQTLPDNYTAGVSNTQRYKMLGNAWTVDVIAHIFREMFSV